MRFKIIAIICVILAVSAFIYSAAKNFSQKFNNAYLPSASQNALSDKNLNLAQKLSFPSPFSGIIGLNQTRSNDIFLNNNGSAADGMNNANDFASGTDTSIKNKLSSNDNYSQPSIESSSTSGQLDFRLNGGAPIISQKMPNDIEIIIAEIKKNSVNQGRSQKEINNMEDAIRQVSATTTDLMAEFFKIVKVNNVSAQNNGGLNNFLGSFIEKILTDFNIIKTAEAGLGIPFGGRVVAAFPCTCTGGLVWELGFAPPLPPSYPVALSFAVESQLYLSHVPGHPGQSFVGFYEPGVQACWMVAPDPADPCFPLLDDGFISPEVGSSL